MIRLSPLAAHHLPDVQVAAAHPSIGAMSTVPQPYPARGAWSWFAAITPAIAAGQAAVFAVLEDDLFCGVISLNQIRHKGETATIDYWVAHAQQGRGVGTAALGLAIAHAREDLQLEALGSGCLLRNVASARLLEKHGFKERSRAPIGAGRFQGEVFRRFGLRLR